MFVLDSILPLQRSSAASQLLKSSMPKAAWDEVVDCYISYCSNHIGMAIKNLELVYNTNYRLVYGLSLCPRGICTLPSTMSVKMLAVKCAEEAINAYQTGNLYWETENLTSISHLSSRIYETCYLLTSDDGRHQACFQVQKKSSHDGHCQYFQILSSLPQHILSSEDEPLVTPFAMHLFSVIVGLAVAAVVVASSTSTVTLYQNASSIIINPTLASLQSSFPTTTNVESPPHPETLSATTPSSLFHEYPELLSTPNEDTATRFGNSMHGTTDAFRPSNGHLFHNSPRANPVPAAPKCAKTPLTRKIGYYQVTNVRKRRCHRITPTEIDINGLTHLNVAYAAIDQTTYKIAASHPDDIGLYKELNARKTPSMQIWIAIGGYDFSDASSRTHRTWSVMTSTVDRRTTFIQSLREFMETHGFQGVDLDWEYPSAEALGGSTGDAANFLALVREMRAAWGKKYGISATLPADAPYLDGYDAKGMEPHVDFFGYLSYDLHPASDTEFIVRSHTDIGQIEKVTAALWSKHLDPKKINLGLSMYGRGYTLANRACARPGCKALGPSRPGVCTNTAGSLFNIEINDLVQQRGLKAGMVSDTMSKQVSWDDQWVGFDDSETLAEKTNWAAESCFGGTVIWSLDMDSGQSSGNVPSPISPVPAAPGKSTADSSTATPGKPSDRPSTSGLTSTQSGSNIAPIIPPPIVPGKSSPDKSTSGRSNAVTPSTRSGQPTSATSPALSASGPTKSPGGTSRPSNAATSSTQSGRTVVPVVPPPIVPGRSSSRSRTIDQSSAVTSSSQTGRQASATVPAASKSTSSSAGVRGQTVPVLPVPVAPGKSTNTVSAVKSLSRSTLSSQTGSKTSGSSKKSGSSTTSSPTSARSQGPGSLASGQLNSATSQGRASAAALIIPGIATIPSPTLAPDSIITKGTGAILGVIPLAVAFQRELAGTEQDLAKFSGSGSTKRDAVQRRQATLPKPDDVKNTLEKLASAYALLGLLEKEVGLIDINPLPADLQKIFDGIKKALPGIDSGTKAGITSLANSIKNPGQVNGQDIGKANSLLGEKGSVTQQVAATFKQLTGWKAPIRSNDIILPGLLTLPSPSLDDSWKGTVVPGVLTIPSPTLHWSKALMSGSNPGGAAGGAAGGTSGGAAGGASGGAAGGAGGGILSGLLGLAKQAEGPVSNAGKELTRLVTSATEDVGGLGAALDSSLSDAYELNERFPPQDVSKVVQAQTANKALSADLKTVLNDLAQFITRPAQSLQTIKRHAPKFVIGGTILALLAKSDSAVIVDFPKPVPIITAPSNSTTKKPVEEFFMVTVENTTVEAFQKFIVTLPDRGAGRQQHYDWPRRYQTYVGNMTLEEALAVNENSVLNGKRIIDMIGPNEIIWEPAFFMPDKRSNQTTLHPRVNPTWEVQRRIESRIHLRMLSHDPQTRLDLLHSQPVTGIGAQYDYRHEVSSGKGAAIYVLDDGFDFQHEQFDRGVDLRPETFVPPFYGNVPITAQHGHGETCAAMAVGTQLGVANQATLVAVKLKGGTGSSRTEALYEAFRFVVQDRWGLVEPEHPDFFLPLVADMWAADIVTIFSGGNKREGADNNIMGSNTPQRFANPNNELIIVGSVDKYGLPSRFDKEVGPAPGAIGRDLQLTGEYTVYAMGEDVDVIIAGSQNGYRKATGNSASAPQIAGLAAYLLRLPGILWPPGQVPKVMKDYIVAKKRTGPRSPDGFGIGYNVIEEILALCQRPPPGFGKSRRWYVEHTELSDYLGRVFRRQQNGKSKEITIFKDGHLTDSKYSNELPGGFEPKPTWSTKTSSLSTTTSSKPKPTSSYKPMTTLAKTKQTCYSDPKLKSKGSSFHEEDMAAFINTTCSASKGFDIYQYVAAKNDKDVNLYLTATKAKATVTFKEKDCLDGFYLAVQNCDKNTDKKQGGSIQLGDVHYYANAAKLVPSPTPSPKLPSAPAPAPAPKPTLTPNPPPAPPRTPNLPPPAKDSECYSKDKEQTRAQDFNVQDMYRAIKNACTTTEKYPFEVFAIADNGQKALRLKAGNIKAPKQKSPFPKDECVSALTRAVDQCERQGDRSYGGHVDTGKLDFDASASKIDQDEKDIDCYTTKEDLEILRSPFFDQPGALAAIQKACSGPDRWQFEHVDYDPIVKNKPLYTFTADVKKGEVWVGFDKGLCVKAFEGIVKKYQRKGEPWGGNWNIEDIKFDFFVGKGGEDGT
ncbi:MAG: hypothetical protein Q9199_007090 [Rusavskia elegans]